MILCNRPKQQQHKQKTKTNANGGGGGGGGGQHNQSSSRIIGISNVSKSVPFRSYLTKEIYGSGEGNLKTIMLCCFEG